jgi:hypothetical protein
MKAAIRFATLSVCLLTPSAARADDGGFWDMLFHWDTKFSGYGTEFHLGCWTTDHKKVEHCEEWFQKLLHPHSFRHQFTRFDGNTGTAVAFKDITHEINVRVSYMHSYGQRVPDDKLAPDDPIRDDHRLVHAFKLLGMYTYRPNGRLDVALGGGFLPMLGAGVTDASRGIVTGGVTLALHGPWYLRGDASYITNTLTGANFGHANSTFTSQPFFNVSGTIGFDLRRIGEVVAARK